MENAKEHLEEALHLNHPGHQHPNSSSLVRDLANPHSASSRTQEEEIEGDLSPIDTIPDKDDTVVNSTATNSARASLEASEQQQQHHRGSHLGVNVEGAEKEFVELQRELSRISQASQRRSLSRQRSRTGSSLRPSLSRQQSKASKAASVSMAKSEVAFDDVEKALSSSEEGDDVRHFDLEDTLRGNRRLEEEAGIKSKQIGVLWDNLTVRGVGGNKTYVPVFPDAFGAFALFPFKFLLGMLGLQRKGKQVDILRGFRGVVKPGEMVLVLGRPGSGCTTFLKTIANQRFGYTGVDGDVMYGPFTAKDFAKRYRGEAIYCQEDDVHLPSLTVGQTLAFALETKVPGKRPGGLSTGEFKAKVVDMLLKMFNIEHTKNTVVGNQFIRGISGGERKRVSIAEMMITGAAVCSHDNSTRGLDASTALDYAKSLRIITNIYRTTTFVSLYQASENIYSQFDKVMVIDQGRQIFLGPIDEARGYFEGLGFRAKPRQDTPDYLTGCTDPFEREYQEGRSEADTPSTPDDLAAAFEKSPFATKISEEMDQFRLKSQEEQQVHEDFKTAVIQGKRHGRAKSVYSIPFYLQIWALMKRQFFLKWQDTFTLAVSWATTIIIAIVIGTVWLQIPADSNGAFTRGGALFISLLFNCFQAFSELAGIMTGRPIVDKHRAYTFYRPSALWFAQIGVDLAFAAVRVLVFSIMVYFMCGFVYSAGAFFIFYLVIISGYLAMTLFFRTVGCLCPDFDSAIKSAALIITLLVLTGGYLIQYQHEQVWLRWIFYVNALGLGFSSMMMNEFSRLNLTCDGTSLIPYGPGYGNISHQVCTLAGSTAGTAQVSGTRYIETSFQYNPTDLWRNWGIIIALIGLFLLTNTIMGEYITYNAGGRTVTFFTKENAERKRLNEELLAKKTSRTSKSDKEAHQDSFDLKIDSKAVLTWEDICYDVPIAGGQQLRLLNNVYGYVRPGEVTALMGASGAGKTTLLDVLASRKNIGVISGSKLIDGTEPGQGFQRGTSYAEQLDVHEANQTVREALRFSAELRQPEDTPIEEKHAYVEQILALLEMEDIADAVIGEPDTGLAVEQRKRVTIGVELAAKPQLLLFLDEPTSGLDSQSAFNIVRFLRKLAAAGQAILCTVHQPNSSLFENFDRLLLLQKGGQTVYFGDIGDDASVLREYFRKHGALCPADANPAEWMLDAIGAGRTRRIGSKDWGDVWNDSEEFEAVKEEIGKIKKERIEEVGAAPVVLQREYATSLWTQIKVVNRRQHLAFWRTPNYGFTRFFNHVIIALLAGLMFLNLNDSRTSLQYRVFVVFQVTVLPALILAQVEPKYDLSRLLFYRESASKSYRQLPFVLSMILAEIPYSLLCAVGFYLPIYFLPGFNPAPSRAGYNFFIVLITEQFAVTLGQMISALTPSTFIAVLFNPFVTIIFALFCGVTVPKPQIPGFWRSWLYQLDPFTRLIGGLVSTELHGLPVVCRQSELNNFTSPAGQTCGAYMSDFFAAGGPGYIVDNSTSDCAYCAYAVGDQFYEPLGIEFSQRWRDLGILAAFIGSSLLILFLAARYLNYNRR